VPFCLSTFSIASLAVVRTTTTGPLHFQLYVLKGRSLAEEMMAAASAAGADVLFVTVDSAITAVRERDVQNGFRSLTRLTPSLLLKLATKPRWLLDIGLSGGRSVRAIDHRPDFGRGILAQATNLSKSIDPSLTWHDIAWIRSRWKGTLVIKGVMTPEDAIRAKDAGADGIVISNHGGRQLDGTSSTIRVLPSVRRAVGADFCVMLDSGIRRGTDIVKAIALGADGVMLGRAYTFALAAAGQRGVADIIAVLRDEVGKTLALMGIASIAELKTRGGDVVHHSFEPHEGSRSNQRV
jgi:isopentenyl diphosphate isomerase/L-lactate dehydrogenase-like FMN-dependent dehydrogenase